MPEPEESVGVGIGTETDPNAPRGLTHHWRLSTVTTRTPDEHAVLLTQLLDLEGLDIASSVTGIAVSSSVPHVTGELRQMAQRWFSKLPCVVLGPGTKSGMPILYDNPKEVGADRIANAVGAYDLYGGPCVVIDMGTATTVEAIGAAGEYLGGAITPGVAISLEALYQHAAALRRVEMVEPRHVIGRSTVESIESGTLYGFAAQVDGLARRFMEELGPSTVVATGGLSRAHRAPFGHHRARRALADPARAPHRLRPQRVGRHGVSEDPLRAHRHPVPLRAHARDGGDRGALVGAWPPGEESGETVAVAGRIMLARPQGKLAFAELRDASGSVQLFATGRGDGAVRRVRPPQFGRLDRGPR